MASSILSKNGSRQDMYVCSRCAFQALKIQSKTTRRWIGQKYLAKVADAEKQWKQKAAEIEQGKQKSMFKILKERGFIHQVTGNDAALEDLMTNKRIGAYVGIDPTASSLHIGHMLPLMSLFWMYLHGFHAVTLLGGATSKVGDPTGRLTSRETVHSSVRTANMVNIHYQLKKLWQNVEEHGRKYGYIWEWSWKRELVNNNAWMNKLPVMEVLQVLGPGMRMGTMLAKDTVKNKMNNGDGMSFAEFTYPLLQAWDWWHMYNTKGIQMQIGGSDQYGNIIAGIDAIKYISTHHPDPDVREGKDVAAAQPVGFTVPLLTTSAGKKFGKSEGNAIWLDKEQTSAFDLYGFFMRQSDADMGRYLRLFTFLPIERIDAIVEEHMKVPQERIAHHILAREFVELVHGSEAAKKAERGHRLLFSKRYSAMASTNHQEEMPQHEPAHITLNNAPQANIKLPQSLIHHKSIGRILYAAGFASSSGQGHRLVTEGSVYIGGMPGQQKAMDDAALSFTPIKLWRNEETANFLIDGKLLILRKGKHNIRIIQVVSDEEWKQSGEKYPGEDLDEAKERQRHLTKESKMAEKAEHKKIALS